MLEYLVRNERLQHCKATCSPSCHPIPGAEISCILHQQQNGVRLPRKATPEYKYMHRSTSAEGTSTVCVHGRARFVLTTMKAPLWSRENPTCPIPALKGCEVNGQNDYGNHDYEYPPPSHLADHSSERCAGDGSSPGQHEPSLEGLRVLLHEVTPTNPILLLCTANKQTRKEGRGTRGRRRRCHHREWGKQSCGWSFQDAAGGCSLSWRGGGAGRPSKIGRCMCVRQNPTEKRRALRDKMTSGVPNIACAYILLDRQ